MIVLTDALNIGVRLRAARFPLQEAPSDEESKTHETKSELTAAPSLEVYTY